ncbi:MAG: hypothetical protein ABEJ79_01950 [Halolamina sp.]
MLDLADLRPRLRRPEYTGRNRCWPCTTVNVAFVVGVAAGAVALGVVGVAVATAVAAVGLALVVLRGYVVPGTPRFAPRLVAPLPVDFGHGYDGAGSDGIAVDAGPSGNAERSGDDPSDGGSATTDDGPEDTGANGEHDDAGDHADSDALAPAADPEALLDRLLAAGVVVADGEALELAADVRADWEAEMATLRERDDEALADTVAEATPFDATVTALDGWFELHGERRASLSRPVAVAEAAAVDVLTDRELDVETAAAAATPLRTFAEVCPACGGDVTETTLTACCGGPGSIYDSPETPVLACESCETVVVEF